MYFLIENKQTLLNNKKNLKNCNKLPNWQKHQSQLVRIITEVKTKNNTM